MSERPRDDEGQARPAYGPPGYLPERASKRARKIVLRSPLGLQWVVAALIAGLVLVVAGVMFLQRSGDPPPAPWVEVGTVTDIGTSRADPDLDVLLVGAGGRIRAFGDVADVTYCEATNRLESTDGHVWNLTGRGLDGAPSLEEHPTLVQDGVVYVDPSRAAEGPAPSDEPAEAGCT